MVGMRKELEGEEGRRWELGEVRRLRERENEGRVENGRELNGEQRGGDGRGREAEGKGDLLFEWGKN